ncbi:cytochrome ubiquinol oxidase subunit I [Klebsiella pneumoniae]|nr:cytochrome ubiquinol oxidase subunit I [Klebsiella pneumoniae]
MFEFDAFHLARLQFAFTVSFHILFPAITIGLASYLVVLEGMWLRTRDNVWRSLYNFWLKIFAVNFGMGVVSGLVMSYQFGTNWSGFSQFAGSITGPLLLYEVLTAFFLEAGFLGVMLFGWNKVPPALHFITTCMVALGTLVSTFWILAFHMAIAAFLSSAMFVGASAAWHLLRGNDSPAIRKMLSMAMWMALLVAPIQAVVGDMHGLNTLEHQPAKIAAIEGHWENRPGEATPLLLFGLPDMEQERTRYGLEIPALGSLILTHSLHKQVPALKDFPKEDRPYSPAVFWSFRIMVGMGVLMIALGICSAWLRYRRRLYHSRPFQWFALCMGPAGLIALVAGWVTTEMGRQPWVIYGLLRTRDAVSLHSTLQMAISLLVFIVVYCAVFGVGYYYIFRLIKKGPQPVTELTSQTAGTPARPLSAAEPVRDEENAS